MEINRAFWRRMKKERGAGGVLIDISNIQMTRRHGDIELGESEVK